jgi:hypothetical protein
VDATESWMYGTLLLTSSPLDEVVREPTPTERAVTRAFAHLGEEHTGPIFQLSPPPIVRSKHNTE